MNKTAARWLTFTIIFVVIGLLMLLVHALINVTNDGSATNYSCLIVSLISFGFGLITLVVTIIYIKMKYKYVQNAKIIDITLSRGHFIRGTTYYTYDVEVYIDGKRKIVTTNIVEYVYFCEEVKVSERVGHPVKVGMNPITKGWIVL